MGAVRGLAAVVGAVVVAGPVIRAEAFCPPQEGWSAPFDAVAPALDNTITALGSWDPDGAGPLTPRLAAGGIFATAGGVAADSVALWDGTSWSALSTGVSSGFPSTFTQWDPDGSGPLNPQLACGGFFTTAGGVTVRNIAHWNGSAWGAFGAGTQDINNFPDVYASTMWDADGPGPLQPSLVIGGDFTVAGGASRRRVALWDGSTWQALGAGMTDSVYCLTTWDPDGAGPANPLLIAGGFFPSAGGVACNRIASWNGTAWQPLGAGLDGQVEAVVSWDPDGAGPANPLLIAGGTFLTSGGVTVNRIAAWDGSTWSAMGPGFNDNRVFGVVSWDADGAGPLPPQLVAAGAFTGSGASPLNRIARWDGSQWQALGAGTDNSIFELITWDPDGSGPMPEAIVAGGSFTHAGGLVANRVAMWSLTPGCPADLDNDGVYPGASCDGGIDVNDLLYFLAAFEAGDAQVDLDNGSGGGVGDGGVDINDLLFFLAHFESGC